MQRWIQDIEDIWGMRQEDWYSVEPLRQAVMTAMFCKGPAKWWGIKRDSNTWPPHNEANRLAAALQWLPLPWGTTFSLNTALNNTTRTCSYKLGSVYIMNIKDVNSHLYTYMYKIGNDKYWIQMTISEKLFSLFNTLFSESAVSLYNNAICCTFKS